MSDRQPAITSVVETILYVGDLARATRFYREVLHLIPAGGDGQRLQAFQLGQGQVLLLFLRGATTEPLDLPGGRIPPHHGSGPHHIGFGVATASYDGWRQHLTAVGIAIESEVSWPAGGRSLYIRDPDQHLVELVTSGIWPND